MKITVLKTQGISFPRSGHGALFHFLKRYFGGELHYCTPGQRRSCGCNSVPCKSAETNYSKNHDFGVQKGKGITIRSDCRYLIQYRNPVRSIASNYYLHLKNHPTHTETMHWEKFALAQIRYWNRFVDKWLILNRQWAGTLTCPYELLVGNPVDTATRVIEFMSEAPLSLPARDRALERTNFRPRGKLEQFEYYDELFFDELERIASPRIVILGLPTYKLSV